MNTMRTLRFLCLLSFLLCGVAVSNQTKAQPGYSVSFQTFYDELSPYGRWVRNPQYGSVWIPDVDRGFQPYSTNGYWEVTEYGNTWVSDYDWGWAPFHYGRWSFDDYNGWFWVPDYEWGPAWVNWRSGGDYYGWAPLGPGISININFNPPSFWWNFVPQRYITYRGWRSYCVPQRRITRVYNQTVIVNNYYRSNNRTYVYGPRRDEIERVTRRSVPVRTIDASPSGRGRVIVAENSRGDDRYNSRGNDRDYRNAPERRGGVIDASPNRGGRDNADYNNRGNSRNDGTAPTNRSSRGDDPVYSSPRNDRYEAPNRTEPSRQPSVPDYGNRNGRGSYETPDRSSRSDRSAEPRVERRAEPQIERRAEPQFERRAEPQIERRAEPQIERRSEPQVERRSEPRVERSAEPRNNDRGGNGGGAPRGASERSSRSPR
ncbi:DUF6600 domain-containing protein [Dyadobacter luticola]|uniref:BcpO-related WXXGXW repeat protein n=1 Tax=Dyadobacter luticola TaxID=1979387 RepID=A0A5R9KWY1_9BACT|nr:DUF6600 domain-containing protein [Dyadobacter luticola]TLV00796.1 hypothetical protein FEN17_15065 [Dyadobacter luticola]